MSDKKKIAIIGGGASGLISSYLLGEKYNITLYEKKSILGGNVQTLNRNVKHTQLPKEINIENGVLGFSQSYYPNFHKLLDHLGVEYHGYKPSISLFSKQQFFPARTKSYLNAKSLSSLVTDKNFKNEVFKLKTSQEKLKYQIEKSSINRLQFKDFDFSQDLYKKYMQALFMLSFSTPFSLVKQLPQSILNSYFLSLPDSTWSFIKGGVFAYMDTILQKTKMQVICDAKNIKISRNKNGVIVNLNDKIAQYDIVIIATTPGCVKNLLTDMSDQEGDVFEDFEDQNFKTIAHKDLSFYKPYKSVYKTPMDLFYKYNSNEIGYNTYQNHFYNLKTKDHYSFAYNLDDHINKSKVLHKANHIVPQYNKKHDAKMNILQHINGQNNTFFAGAYTDNGLHEGAAASALNISNKLGGMIL